MARGEPEMKRPAITCGVAFALLTSAACSSAPAPVLQIPQPSALSVEDVQSVIAQGVGEARARNVLAAIAVVDRVGNLLGLFKMSGAESSIKIDGGRGVTGGLDGLDVVPVELGAISKAITAAYFSSAGNAFTTRTAGQILQEHFNPGTSNAPSGPLFGVQYSQLTCSDVTEQASAGTIGPKRSPLGFAADPGGLPLYKEGSVVGAVGVIVDGRYSIDRNVTDPDLDPAELVAVAGAHGFEAPESVRADHITVRGLTLRFTDSDALASNPAMAPSFATLEGNLGELVAEPGYGGNPIVAGVAYGSPASGIVPDTDPALAGLGNYVLVDANDTNRYAAKAGAGGLRVADVQQLLSSTLKVANRTRSQVRRPLGSIAQVSVVVVDTTGDILGYARSPDALVFSADVVVQKARTAVFFSSPSAGASLAGIPALMPYLEATRSFEHSSTAFSDGVAYSTRTLNALAQPFFPDGIDGAPPGPLAKPTSSWSVFNNGLELDLVSNKLLASLTTDDRTPGCTGISVLLNGMTLVAGGLPVYINGSLVGGVGVSGDGDEQDDLIAYVGVAEAGQVLADGLDNAPSSKRADLIAPQGTGTRLRYVSCPPEPFLDGRSYNACQTAP
jgi:uncharacterized protein GlcG (DUF336 family)